jgi:hypothetical protein
MAAATGFGKRLASLTIALLLSIGAGAPAEFVKLPPFSREGHGSFPN